jgi:hypothetical protein
MPTPSESSGSLREAQEGGGRATLLRPPIPGLQLTPSRPCNTSAENQAKYLVPNPLNSPCRPRYQQPFGSFATDWDEIDTALEFIRSLRRDRALKVNLVGWSRRGMRVIGFAALRADNID